MVNHVGEIAALSAQDAETLLTLNNAHQKETSFLTQRDWDHLVSQAYSATAIGTEGFLITFDQGADYDSPNFVWFEEKYDVFVYVDRIVVSAAARGQGIARTLYESLINMARADGHTKIVCEVNLDPPNPGSDAFHDQMGFVEVGRAHLKEREKTVRYLCKSI
jgi:predicted GNAT superfamily acetyltransferase